MMNSANKIAVVGQGVIGLTCALKLLERGYRVHIYSREKLGDTTSMAAGAYWWPHRAYPKERIARWAKASLDQYARCRLNPGTGVRFERHFRFCLDPDDGAYARYLLDEWQEIDGSKYGIPCPEAYMLTLPIIDVSIFLPYLRDLVKSQGGSFHIKELESPSVLFPEYALAVNCAGVWAYHFVDDKEVFPIRGQAVRVSLPDGLRESRRLYQKSGYLTLVLPRTDDVILGGTAQAGNWSREPSQEDTVRILERCAQLVPRIKDAQMLGVSAGLRPGRKQVRLELEMIAPGRPVIHNYGHGGGGYTVAWGCADEVTELVEDYFSS